MTRRRSSGARSRGPIEPLLVDLPAAQAGWLGHLPPCPAGLEVTAARAPGARPHAPVEALQALGYVPAGALPHAQAVVQLAVPRHALTAHPSWWATVLTTASAVWDTALGPVALARAADRCAHDDRVATATSARDVEPR